MACESEVLGSLIAAEYKACHLETRILANIGGPAGLSVSIPPRHAPRHPEGGDIVPAIDKVSVHGKRGVRPPRKPFG
jgi:hypothetical protein